VSVQGNHRDMNRWNIFASAQARMALAHPVSNENKKRKKRRENRGIVFQWMIRHPRVLWQCFKYVCAICAIYYIYYVIFCMVRARSRTNSNCRTEWTEWYLIERCLIRPSDRKDDRAFFERVTWFPAICFGFYRLELACAPDSEIPIGISLLKPQAEANRVCSETSRPVPAAVGDFGMNWQRTWYISRGLFRTILALAIEGQCRNNEPHYLRKSTRRHSGRGKPPARWARAWIASAKMETMCSSVV